MKPYFYSYAHLAIATEFGTDLKIACERYGKYADIAYCLAYYHVVTVKINRGSSMSRSALLFEAMRCPEDILGSMR